ncbi:C3a anaphylatoxin chemotactic receptor-like [Dendropsophus ebraccatus]|uniref:C3a anaphylatoxin chemotactic receptor-like n=1 Tax=Dendropsophus ebraccatus TaxID=150705 RepID=UPI00383154C9
MLDSKLRQHLPVQAKAILLHIPEEDRPMSHLMHIFILVAKRCLLANWLQPTTPLISAIVAQVKHYLRMDQLDAEQCKTKRTEQFITKWKPFMCASLSDQEIAQTISPFRQTDWTNDPTCTSEAIELYRNYHVIEKTSIILYAIICALGTISNGLVILIAGLRMKKTVSAVWFLNLAIADFLCCASLLLRIVNVVYYYLWTADVCCKLSIFLFLLNMSASVLLLMAMSIDRCMSVTWPFWMKVNKTRKLVAITASIVWVLSVLWTVYVYLYYSNNRLTVGEWCTEIERFIFEHEDPIFQTIKLIRLFVMFLIPFLIIVISYVIIFFQIRKSKGSQRSRRLYRIITAVILCFFICWCPYYIWPLTPMYHKITFETFIVDITIINLACLNSCINPIIYVFMSPNFKQGFLRSFSSRFERSLSERTTDQQ